MDRLQRLAMLPLRLAGLLCRRCPRMPIYHLLWPRSVMRSGRTHRSNIGAGEGLAEADSILAQRGLPLACACLSGLAILEALSVDESLAPRATPPTRHRSQRTAPSTRDCVFGGLAPDDAIIGVETNDSVGQQADPIAACWRPAPACRRFEFRNGPGSRPTVVV